MVGNLLQTKMYVPKCRPTLIPRPCLIQKLNNGLSGKLTFVSAPAGFGKTTLIVDWGLQISDSGAIPQSENHNPQLAWFSLDENDNDPTRFLTYFVTALSRIEGVKGDIGADALSMLQSPQPPPTTAVITTLINDITRLSGKWVFILDDYHVITETVVHQTITFLLDHMPSNLHLVITSRTTPPLPLPRLRARGLLTEIDQQALRFTTAETAVLLNDTLHLNLTTTQISALETRTEGWIAGLYMAAVSMQNRHDVAQFIDTFSGGHRYIFDYLVDEVLAQQPEAVRDFLRKTAVLSHLHADLCDALLETVQSPISNPQSQSILEQLETAHLFITPLDDRREWYRVHPLFADVLRQQLSADEQKTQRQRAAHWFAEQGMLPEAIHHAIAAHALEDAAQLIQQAAHPTLMRGEHQTLQRWLSALPDKMVQAHSTLALYQGWLYFIGGQIGEAAIFAEAAHANLPADVLLVQRGRLDCLRAWVALHQDSAETAVSLAQSAIQNLGNNDKQFRILAGMVLGEAYDMMGDTNAAVLAYQESVGTASSGGNTIFAQVALLHLAIGLNDTGRRREAVALVQKYAREDGNSLLRLVSGTLAFEANEMETAVAHIQAGIEVARQLNIGGMLLYGQHMLAQMQLAQGNWETALQTASAVGEMGSAQQSSFYINWATAFSTRIQMQHETKRLQDEIPRLPEKRPLPWEEPAYFIATRQLLAQNQPDEALRLLALLESSVRPGGRERIRLTILLRQALAHQMKNDETKAVTLLHKALQLAAPEGYVFAFLDEGKPLMRLMKQNLSRLSETAVLTFVGRILAASGDEPTPQTAVDPLTEREIDILRLIAAGRSNPEIGQRLFLSLNTVKWHLKNIYTKLHVHNRVEAAARASERNLL